MPGVLVAFGACYAVARQTRKPGKPRQIAVNSRVRATCQTGVMLENRKTMLCWRLGFVAFTMDWTDRHCRYLTG